MKTSFNKYTFIPTLKRQARLTGHHVKSPINGSANRDIHFRKLIENSYDGITLLDRDLQIIYRSHSAERINGWGTAERSKCNMNDMIHTDHIDQVKQLINEVFDNPGIPKICSFKSKHFDGHYIWIECTYTNFFNDPDINAIVCNFRDISEKKQSDELLQQSIKELFSYQYALNESSIVAITDQKGVIRHVNDNFCKISKYSKDELIGQDHRIINSSYHDKTFIRNLWVTITGGNIWKGEIKNKAKDGSFYWVDTTIVPFLNDQGKPYQYVAIRSDITARMMNREKLIESEKFIKTVTDNLPALIAYWDANLKCCFANKPYRDWMGKTEHEMLGIHKNKLGNAEEFELLKDHIQKVLNGNPQRFERTIYKGNGQKIFTDTQYLPDKQGDEIKGFFSLIYDVTAIKLVEKEINNKTKQLEDVLESITDGFIALDENQCYTHANKKIGEMLGRAPESLIGKNIWECFPDAVGSPTYHAIQTAFAERKYVCNEDYYQPLNLWQENRVFPSGNGLSMFIRDITKLKQEEQHLKLLESVITNAADAVMITGAGPMVGSSPVILYVNEAFTKMTGYAADEVIGRTPRLLQGPGTDINELKRLQEALQKGQPCEVTVINYKKNGEEFWINFSVNPVADQKGNCTHFIAIERDVTERRKTRLQIEQLNERFSLISKETNVALFEWDFEKNELWRSESFSAMFGFDPRQWFLTRQEWKSKLPAGSVQTISNIIKDIHEKALNNWQGEINYIKPDKTLGTLLSRGVVIRHENKKAIRIVGSCIDITREKTEELQKVLLAEISRIFNEPIGLNDILHKVLRHLSHFGNFELAAFWLISSDKKKIKLMAKFSGSDKGKNFLTQTSVTTSYKKGESLPGIVWETKQIQYWNNEDNSKKYKKAELGKNVGLKSAFGMPLSYNDEIVGVLVFGFSNDDGAQSRFKALFDNLNTQIGAEIRRKQLEEELNQIFIFAPDILCTGGIDLYFKKVNPAMCELLEYTEDEMLTMPMDTFIHPDDFVKTVFEFENAADTKPTFNIENRLVTKSGKIKWLAWTSTRASDEGLFFSVAKDITDRKGLEELLDKATTLARIGGWETDLEKGIVHWSEMTRNIHEAEPGFEPNLDQEINFFIEGENRDLMVRVITDAYKLGKAGDVELQIITAKGNIRWVRVIVEAEFADGKCLRVYGSFQDIDALKKAEITGKIALEERNIILESIDDAFFAVDKNWTVTYWNNMAEKVLFKQRDEMLGYNLWEVFKDSIDSLSYKKYNEAIETNKAVHFEDYYYELNKWYEISGYPSDTGLSVYFKDITERKLTESRLTELNESLQKHAKELAISNAELEQFAYVASHDLQEPLRMVTSFMTQLEKKYGDVVDDRGKQYIHFAVDGAKRMRQIILDLLEFSKVGRTDDGLEEVDLNKVVNEILGLYRKKIEDIHANVIFNNLPTIPTFKTPIRQVLQNLISNGLKYHKFGEPPILKILFKETKTYWQISVEDNGIGIEPEYFDKIFIIFQRLHNKDEYSGTGMGLAIAKKIVENLGGKIWVKSDGAHGSAFYFTILKNKK